MWYLTINLCTVFLINIRSLICFITIISFLSKRKISPFHILFFSNFLTMNKHVTVITHYMKCIYANLMMLTRLNRYSNSSYIDISLLMLFYFSVYTQYISTSLWYESRIIKLNFFQQWQYQSRIQHFLTWKTFETQSVCCYIILLSYIFV